MKMVIKLSPPTHFVDKTMSGSSNHASALVLVEVHQVLCPHPPPPPSPTPLSPPATPSSQPDKVSRDQLGKLGVACAQTAVVTQNLGH